MSAGSERPTWALVGARCSGKSTLGRLLAQRRGCAFIDLDQALLARGRWAGFAVASAGELLERAGPARFRDLEAWALRQVLEPGTRAVLATGGGAVEREDNRAWLRRAAWTVFLSVPVEVLQARMRADPTARPSLTGRDPVQEVPLVLARREPLYRGVADRVLECGLEPPERLADLLPTN